MYCTADIFLMLIFLKVIAGEEWSSKCSKTYYTRPICQDNPDGYGCDCGAGYHWNSRVCLSSAVDSSFIFSEELPLRYSTLWRHIPDLSNFTIAAWVKVKDVSRSGTVISYVYKERQLVTLVTGPTVRLTLSGQTFNTGETLEISTWTHIVFTWSHGLFDPVVSGFIDGKLILQGVGPESIIPGNGDLILGQLTLQERNGASDFSLVGEVSQVNIWDYVMKHSEAIELFSDCTFFHCGNIVEWTDFRTGTQGPLKFQWPSGIFEGKGCHPSDDAAVTCEEYCSHVKGIQCNQETIKNIRWERIHAGQNISVACPGRVDAYGNATAFATRSCHTRDNKKSEWGKPETDECISESYLRLKQDLNKFTSLDKSIFDEHLFVELFDKVRNMSTNRFDNPVDLDVVLDCLSFVSRAQSIPFEDNTWPDGLRQFDETNIFYPSFEQTESFNNKFLDILDNLLDGRNRGWTLAEPPGAEGDHTSLVIEHFGGLMATSFLNHIRRNDISYSESTISTKNKHIAIKATIITPEEFEGIAFPDNIDVDIYEVKDDSGSIVLDTESFNNFTQTLYEVDDYIPMAAIRLNSSVAFLPNHNTIRKSKEDNINSLLFGLYLYNMSTTLLLNGPNVTIYLQYKNNFNISNPVCVRLKHSSVPYNWRWSGENCWLVKNNSDRAICKCTSPGLFAITTDMYDDNWKAPVYIPSLMTIPSYTGCAVSVLLNMISLIMLIYLRAVSLTATLHKHFAATLVTAQLVFMFGINRTDDKEICHVFAILIHYFFLTSFGWLLNECFNLYIVVTYTAHNKGNQVENSGGSKWRFYVLGWVLPAVLVGVFVGSHMDDYYAPDMCWIAREYLWLFLGPAIGVVCVTILVMIFTAKEHHESSYAQNAKSNKAIMNHTKAVWSQLVLLTLLWSFAILSILMKGDPIKYLYALFNVLQGSFFLVFYYLLNDEIKKIYKIRRKKRNQDLGLDMSESQETLGEEICRKNIVYMEYTDPNEIIQDEYDQTLGNEKQVTGNKRSSTYEMALSKVTEGEGVSLVLDEDDDETYL